MQILCKDCTKFGGKLFAGTVPANKKLFAGTVPANKKLFAGTVPANKKLFAGTVIVGKEGFRDNDSYTYMCRSHF